MISLEPGSESEQITIQSSLKEILVLDYTQPEVKIYNQLLANKGETFTNSCNQNNELSWLFSAPISSFAERNILICKHSSCFDDAKPMLECIMKIKFDKSKHFKFTKENWSKISRKCSDTHQLFQLVSDLESDPMDLSIKATLRDCMVRL
jgi:hypothetical protein